MAVPVLDSNRVPLMPCSEKRARKLMDRGDARPYWKQGVFCIILQREPSDRQYQDVGIGFDPGSKRTGVTVSTKKRVVVNLLLDTPYWVKKKMEDRRALRRSRRYRNTPYRKCRYNRSIGGIPPSTKARWQAHLRVINVFKQIVPLIDVVLEDVTAVTKKGVKRWNKNFSPLEVGKKWFEEQVGNLGLNLYKFKGYDTKGQRDYRGFKKSSSKTADKWEAHNVDSHCLIELLYGNIETFKGLLKCDFFKRHRRNLYQQQLKKGGKKQPYGGTMSMGIKRGTLVFHPKYEKKLVGGSSNGKISLHHIENYGRATQHAKVGDVTILTTLKWTVKYIGTTGRLP